MLRVACGGLWLALCASFALSAGIIGVPVAVILGEILRATVLIGLAVGAFTLGRAVVHEWRRGDNNESSV
jgi:mannose/fructose/N-acetylgalactosamine-specific phosphotransferase system component IID